MKRPTYSPPDPFSMLPLLSILPSTGKLDRLEGLTSSFFARLEHVMAISRSGGEVEPEVARRLGAEEAMLRQVLDWLKVTPGEG
jgi:hypothetical protein